jgi:adenylyl-sulfate kinase
VNARAAWVCRADREALNGHAGGVLYFTGLSGAGKSTIATLLEQRLHRERIRTCLLDGDVLRSGLCSNLGFCDADRVENMRRVTEVARLMVDAGLVVITALIAPFRAERAAARARFAPGDFLEVFVDAPLAVCEARDPKGLYRRARQGAIVRFTGIDSPYEPPPAPELRIDTTRCTPEQAASALLERLAEFGFARPLQGSEASRSSTSASSPWASMRVQTCAGEAPAGPEVGRRLAQR